VLSASCPGCAKRWGEPRVNGRNVSHLLSFIMSYRGRGSALLFDLDRAFPGARYCDALAALTLAEQFVEALVNRGEGDPHPLDRRGREAVSRLAEELAASRVH
jgi:hypothetical protein